MSEAATTYAGQQEKITQTYLQYNAVTDDLIVRYHRVYDRSELAKLSKAELRKLDLQLKELEARVEELHARVIQMEQISLQ